MGAYHVIVKRGSARHRSLMKRNEGVKACDTWTDEEDCDLKGVTEPMMGLA